MAAWLIPCSPQIFDAESAFREEGSVVWHQDVNVVPGDVAYIYVTAPVKAIRCSCIIRRANLPVRIRSAQEYVIDRVFCAQTRRRYMELELVKQVDSPLLAYRFLMANGLNGAIRSQRRAVPELEKYILGILQER